MRHFGQVRFIRTNYKWGIFYSKSSTRAFPIQLFYVMLNTTFFSVLFLFPLVSHFFLNVIVSCEILDTNFFFDSDAHSVGLVKFQDAYPFGVDPSWRGSRSELPFLNSLKMKMSILLGVTQMNLGIILSYFNARFCHNSLDFRCVLLPSLSHCFPRCAPSKAN